MSAILSFYLVVFLLASIALGALMAWIFGPFVTNLILKDK